MSNNFFRFKQFTVHQENVAMKVSTDACLFGAYTEVNEAKSILDIGAGTGLLSLMLAQKSTAIIDAVEMDEAAFLQTKENFSDSPWKERITLHHADILDWYKKAEKKFDLIISNPPFFTNHFKSAREQRNLAKHTGSLSQENLIEAVLQLLQPETGVFHLMLPKAEMERFITYASSKGLHLNKKLSVRNYRHDDVFRIMAVFSFNLTPVVSDELFIWNAPTKYSDRFMELLRPYYLYL